MLNSKFDQDFEKSERSFNRMFKLFAVFFVCVLCLILGIWGLTGYLLVTKGPETVQRVERAVDAYTNKLEQETQKSDQKPE